MKRVFLIIIALLLFGTLCACAAKNYPEEQYEQTPPLLPETFQPMPRTGVRGKVQ